ncbi:MAG: M3 family oligoendopeptidase [Clostridium perfringens]|nr:M3 family oligoendopeptidase [Clostridium perfringens]
MELNWNLKDIYISFEDEDFKSDLERLDRNIEELNSWCKEVIKSHDNEKIKLEEYIKRLSEFRNISNRLGSFIHLNLSTDTKNKEALKYSDILDKKLTKCVEAFTNLEKWISKVHNIESVIKESKVLKEHEFILKSIVKDSRYTLSSSEENIIANMENTGSNAFAKLKNTLISTLKVNIEVDGKDDELPLTKVLTMANNKDKEIRKKAYEAEIESYKKIEEPLAACLNGIKGEVLTVCDLRGYKSPLDKSLIDSRMDEESLNAMMDAMKESLPIFRKYLKRKAEILGYNNGLPFYEIYAPVVECDMSFPYEKGTDFVEKNFRTFSDNLANFARKAIDSSWIDVYPKEGKVGGAFCSNLHFIGESRFLLNYGNSLKDVITLAHELGHGFHGECLKGESILNSSYPMPIAETASTFCETIIKKAAVKEASKEEALAILEAEISGCTQVIVDIYSRFLFEKRFFENRRESALSVSKIKELMIEAQKEAYGDGLDENYLHPYMWTWKPHYYYAHFSFYNFPYAFGLLFAKGLYAKYLEKGKEFSKDYEKLLSITGKNNIADVTMSIGIDIHDKIFWKSSLKTIEEDIERFIELSK